MASSGKSEKLGLSLWEAGDRPERLDFRQDNEKLEETVGGHLADTALHLSQTEKSFLGAPYWKFVYIGNGKEKLTAHAFSKLPLPGLILVLANGRPPTMPGENGKVDAYWDFYSYYFNKYPEHYLGGGGITMNIENHDVSFANVEGDVMNVKLNEKGVYYIAYFLYPTPYK